MPRATMTGTLAPHAETPTRDIRSLIGAQKAAQAALAKANRALTEASDILKGATEAAVQADTALSAGLVATGPVFEMQEDGTALIYSPDGAGSFHVIQAKELTQPDSGDEHGRNPDDRRSGPDRTPG